MKKVKFENGKYGVRPFWFFGWYFVDLRDTSFKWSTSSKYFRDCMGNEELVDGFLSLRKVKHTVCK